jgi:hypothetical protein
LVPGIVLTTAALLLSGCGGGDAEPASAPGEDATTTEASPSATVESSPGSSPGPVEQEQPDKPEEPRFRDNRAGKRAFVSYIIDGWGDALQTNDPSVLLDASGKKPCRGCDTLRKELRERKKEGWYVQFPGADVRNVKFRRDGDVEVATARVNIPGSQSFFEDGTFRNDNKARKRVPFLLDIRADGRGKKRHWRLLAFSVK